jgi:hypothetical protein
MIYGVFSHAQLQQLPSSYNSVLRCPQLCSYGVGVIMRSRQPAKWTG